MKRFLFLCAVTLTTLFVLAPIYLVGISAMGGRKFAGLWPKPFLPVDWTLDPFLAFLNVEGVLAAAMNSLLVALLTVLLSLLLGLPAGYALARFSFRGADGFKLLVILTRAFPLAILALPLTVLFLRVGLYDTALGVALIHTTLALPFATLVSASLFAGIPRELEEAAWVFGCNRLTGFLKIVLPLAIPGLVAIGVFAFVISWNEVFASAVLTLRHRTLTAYLLTILAESPLHYRFAGGFLLIMPSVIFIFIVRRYLFGLWGISNR